jgi:hypothetical protein
MFLATPEENQKVVTNCDHLTEVLFALDEKR